MISSLRWVTILLFIGKIREYYGIHNDVLKRQPENKQDVVSVGEVYKTTMKEFEEIKTPAPRSLETSDCSVENRPLGAFRMSEEGICEEKSERIICE